MNGPERLSLLLPLANGDPLAPVDVRRRLLAFLDGFEAPGLRLRREAGMWRAHSEAGPRELAMTQRKLEMVFAAGFLFDGTPEVGTENIGPDDIALPLKFPTLRFLALCPSPARGRKQSRRGSFTLMVDGKRLSDLVPFLAMHLLTTGGIAVSQCSAPGYRRWDERCKRIFIWKGRGRPPKVCSAGCGARVKAKAKHDKDQSNSRELADWRKRFHKQGTKVTKKAAMKRRTR